MTRTIPVIDLFAGPGGLSEGFVACGRSDMKFDVRLSVEKDSAAHRTLLLRAFFRTLRAAGRVPDDYYSYIRGEIPSQEELFKRHPEEFRYAETIAWRAALGEVSHSDVIDRIRRAVSGSDHWILLGGPPCQAYSVIGRVRMRGREGFDGDHRHTLYEEYVRILAECQPSIFVMENVKGLLSSQHRGGPIFHRILADLREPARVLGGSIRAGRLVEAPRYRVWSFVERADDDTRLEATDYLIESEKYGVPQRRHRVLLLGIREDHDVLPELIEPSEQCVTVRDVIDDLPPIRSRLTGDIDSGKSWMAAVRRAMRTGYFRDIQCTDVKRAFRRSLNGVSQDLPTGGRFISGVYQPRALRRWLTDPRIGGVIQHEARSHMQSDLHRYLFAASFSAVKGRSPGLDEFPKGLWPRHENAIAGAGGRIEKFRDRFRVQLHERPATTVTAHIGKDGHYFIHPDPGQCRSLTVREAARLQTFPDNYLFEGNRTQQYVQVGNAVPPFLAKQLAGVVADVIDRCMDLERLKNRRRFAREVA